MVYAKLIGGTAECAYDAVLFACILERVCVNVRASLGLPTQLHLQGASSFYMVGM